MITSDQAIKYHEGRLWASEHKDLVDDRQHSFSIFYAGSDWDDPQAAWEDYLQRIVGSK